MWDRRVSLYVSGFYYDYKDIQVESFLGGPPTIYNGPSAKLYVVDADIEVRVTRDFNISSILEVLHSYFGNFPSAEVLGACDCEGSNREALWSWPFSVDLDGKC